MPSWGRHRLRATEKSWRDSAAARAALVFACAGCFAAAAAAMPVHQSARRAKGLRRIGGIPTAVPLYGRYELSWSLSASYPNPFDPSQFNFYANFLSPDGARYRVACYFYQPFRRSLSGGREQLTPAGKPVWKLDFTPGRVGVWQCSVTARDAVGAVFEQRTSFRVTPSPAGGFLRRARRNPEGFAYASGTAYYPVGEDMCWDGNQPITQFYRWLADLSAAGGNWIRLWMTEGKLGLEWSGPPPHGQDFAGYHGVGFYSQEEAWKLDKILDEAAARHVNVMLCLGTYGELTTGGYFNEGAWARNPYNAANGGPCKAPTDFWTSAEAQRLYQQRLRYIMARYGWRTNIFGWEFWNEANAPTSWIRKMAEYVKGTGPYAGRPADPFGHLLSTTYGSPAIWKLPEIDFTMSHNYGEGSTPDWATVVHGDAQENAVFGKPHLMAEFGIDWRKSDAQYDPTETGINLHNALWSAMASGDAGTAMIWWWDDYIAPDNLYHEFTAPARFAAHVDWAASPWHVVNCDPPQTSSAAAPDTDLVVPATGGWGKSKTTSFTLSPTGAASPGLIPGFLYSPAKPDLRSNPTFNLSLSHPAQFLALVNQVSSSADLQFDVDGKPAANYRLPAAPMSGQAPYKSTAYEPQYRIYLATYDREYGIDLPAGEHTVTLDVVNGDWASIKQIRVTRYRSGRYPEMNVYAVANSRGQVVLWAQNAAHNWMNAYQKRPMPGVPATRTVLRGLPAGRYTVRWWNTETGVVERTSSAVSSGAKLTLELPPIQTDIAAILQVQRGLARR